jgi:DMSO/TMAO reductase YedYZ molybdopterin-dependent catalytic subunit
LTVDRLQRLLQRADERVKAAASRPDPGAGLRQAADLLEEARDLLDEVADADRRRDLATAIARRMGDVDRAEVAATLGPSPGVARAPTDVDDPARVPPGQHLTPGWPVLHVGSVPPSEPVDWRVTVTGRVERRMVLGWEELRALPRVTSTSDFHCVTGWSRLDNTWEGVRFRDLLGEAGPRPDATHAVVSGRPAYSANLPLEDLLGDDVLLAWGHDGEPLSHPHGGPLRLVVPHRYGWKSVKWAFEVRLFDRDVPGYWEERGYHDVGDPFLEQRYRGD